MSMIHEATLPAYFKELVDQTLRRRNLNLEDSLAFYLVQLLDCFSRSDQLFPSDNRAMAEIYLESLQQPSGENRILQLKRVGDTSLYVSGYFSDSLRQKLYDIDY